MSKKPGLFRLFYSEKSLFESASFADCEPVWGFRYNLEGTFPLINYEINNVLKNIISRYDHEGQSNYFFGPRGSCMSFVNPSDLENNCVFYLIGGGVVIYKGASSGLLEDRKIDLFHENKRGLYKLADDLGLPTSKLKKT